MRHVIFLSKRIAHRVYRTAARVPEGDPGERTCKQQFSGKIHAMFTPQYRKLFHAVDYKLHSARTENIRVNEFALGEIYDSTLWISASMRLDANAFAGSASSSCGMSTAVSA